MPNNHAWELSFHCSPTRTPDTDGRWCSGWDDFRAYADHPDHVAFIQERLTPVLDQRASLQFEL